MDFWLQSQTSGAGRRACATPICADSLSVARLTRPADRDSGTGGDFSDVFSLPGGRTGVFIGDACGHGPEAAALAARIGHLLRRQIAHGSAPSEALTCVNEELLWSLPPESSATLFFGIIAADGLSLEYASAGHEPPLLFPADGSPGMPLMPTGVLLGVCHSVYGEARVELGSGDALALFTDGFPEARQSRTREFVGERRFSAILHRHLRGHRSLTGCAEHIYADVCLFCGTCRQRDDALLLLIEILPAAGSDPVRASALRGRILGLRG